jgi:hypothetical protein
MSSEVEAAGAAMTAGLAGAAIDGRGAHGEAHGGACANCGATLDGQFCAQCGQPAHIHRTLGHMVEEFLHGILHFDTRAWKTLPLLLFRPGTLTHAYVHGQRARFISPLAMFLLTVFTMFFVYAFTGGVMVSTPVADIPAAAELAGATNEVVRAEIDLDRLRAEAIPEEADARNAHMARLAAAEARLASAEHEVDRIAEEISLANSGDPESPPATPTPSDAGAPDSATADAHAPAEDGDGDFQIRAGESVYDQIAQAAREGKINIKTGWKTLDKKIQHKLENPELAVYKIQNTAYKFSFLLVPISLPFVWLMFAWKRGVTLFDHTVFILYGLSFVSLLFIVLSLSAMVPGVMGWMVLITVFGIPAHSFFHLKGAYSLGLFSAFWRTYVLLVFALVSLILFLLAIIALGFVG